MKELILTLLTLHAISLHLHAQTMVAGASLQNAIDEISRLAPPGGVSTSKNATFVNYRVNPEDTKGSSLLFASWPKGYVLSAADTVLNNERLFLNFDKMTHVLYFTFDGKTIVKAETSQAREIHFIDSGNHLTLVRAGGLDPQKFYQRLSDSAGNNHYGLYKEITTTFHPADYKSNGITSTGNNYDEFIDSYEYYLILPGGKGYTSLKLKKKAIREALASAAPKVDDYLSRHGKDEINEAFLVGLVNQLNN